jgi:hypothetical protein
MHKSHVRCPSIIRRPHLGSIPASQEQALERRHELDAQQRMYTEVDSSREIPRVVPRCPS